MALTLSLISMLSRNPSELIVVPFEPAPLPYIVIRVPVSDGACEALIFDTGTNTTVLSPLLAARVGLAGAATTTIESLNGSVTAVEGEVRGIGFEGIPASGRRVAIAASVDQQRTFGDAVAGLYGHNWLTGTDYLIDYDARRLVMGSAGRLPAPSGGIHVPLTLADGRPVVTVTVRGQVGEAFDVRLVLDSGADHVTLFGRAAARLARAPGRETMLIDSGFGTREVPTAGIRLDVGGRPRQATAEIRIDLGDRGEDGLLPTSLFHSVFVSVSDGLAAFDAHLDASDLPRDSRREGRCRASPATSKHPAAEWRGSRGHHDSRGRSSKPDDPTFHKSPVAVSS